jgi:hypothetical protein
VANEMYPSTSARVHAKSGAMCAIWVGQRGRMAVVKKERQPRPNVGLLALATTDVETMWVSESQ